MPQELPETFSEDFVKALEAKVGITNEEPPDEAASSAAGAGEEEVEVPETETPAAAEEVDEPETASSEAGEETPAKKTYWDQTPEEKRAQVFNDTKAHSARQHEELEAIKAENARLKAEKETPQKSPAKAPAADLDGWIREAIVADDESGLSQSQREIRKAAVDLDSFIKEVLKPVQEKVAATTAEFTKAQDEVKEQRIYLKRLEAKAASDTAGFYDDQLADAKKELAVLESRASIADGAAIRAEREFEKLDEKRKIHVGQTRARADRFHREEVQERQTKTERAAEETRLAAAQAEIDTEWNTDLEAVRKESGLSGPVWDRLSKTAFKYIEEKAATQTIPKGAFKGLILEAVGPLLQAMGKSTASTLAEKRDAIASEPGAGRVATKTRDAAPIKSMKDLQKDAIREMQSAFKSGVRF